MVDQEPGKGRAEGANREGKVELRDQEEEEEGLAGGQTASLVSVEQPNQTGHQLQLNSSL